ncbi:MAG: hypothetical protein ACXVNF_12810 [Neobacillus sp.]
MFETIPIKVYVKWKAMVVRMGCGFSATLAYASVQMNNHWG